MKPALPSPLALSVIAALALGSTAFGPPAAAQTSPAASQSASQPVTGSDADNTRVNRRDRNDATKTPTDQSNHSSVVDLVAKVRKAIVHDDSLSVKAHNVKVVANGGVVTLRGPVASADEKARVEKDVSGVRGVSRVDNQLDIDTD
jgi:osmotically-inducible protein OsmY